mmetsp:Transcript_19266/g.46534  ORF Transcript_19266/g.46534 Transcript_19266/m.46534 type:complete len:217 (+) Transcript_19266:802-1452(+)
MRENEVRMVVVQVHGLGWGALPVDLPALLQNLHVFCRLLVVHRHGLADRRRALRHRLPHHHVAALDHPPRRDPNQRRLDRVLVAGLADMLHDAHVRPPREEPRVHRLCCFRQTLHEQLHSLRGQVEVLRPPRDSDEELRALNHPHVLDQEPQEMRIRVVEASRLRWPRWLRLGCVDARGVGRRPRLQSRPSVEVEFRGGRDADVGGAILLPLGHPC